MDPLRLLQDELEYELEVRGFTNLRIATVQDMRKTFAQILRDEKLGTLTDSRTAAFDRDADLAACTRKTVELQAMAANISGRLARLASEADEITESIEELRSELDILESSVPEKWEETPNIATDVSQPSTTSILPTPAVNNVMSIPS
ncbi:hypothetical protein CBL_20011 [Carabus blaptoides fortunei]